MDGEMNQLRRKLDEVKKKLEVTLKENKELKEDNNKLKKSIMTIDKENENLKQDNEFMKSILRVIWNLSITEINAGYEIRDYLEKRIIGLEKLLKS